MEDGLVLDFNCALHTLLKSLNPCCNGRWSRTTGYNASKGGDGVLILVVMEDGLVHRN